MIIDISVWEGKLEIGRPIMIRHLNNVTERLLDIVAILVDKEATGWKVCCADGGTEYGGYVCSRARGHTGKHIAIAGPQTLQIWDNGHLMADNNDDISHYMSEINSIVGRIGCYPKIYSTCENYYSPYVCNRSKLHTGLHVAIGGGLLAAWSNHGCH
jgi:hypothetical protein